MKSMNLIAAITLGLSGSAAMASSHMKDDAGKGHDMKAHCAMHMKGMSAAETSAMVDKMFEAIDTSKDGLLSKDEFARHHQQMVEKHQPARKDSTGHDHRETHKGN